MTRKLSTFVIPTLDSLPPVVGHTFDVVACTDFLLNRSICCSYSVLNTDFLADAGRWRISSPMPKPVGAGEIILEIAQRGRFRAVLAHFAMRFMDGDVYGGFREGIFAHRERSHYFALYIANDGLRGYWLRLYIRARSPENAA